MSDFIYDLFRSFGKGFFWYFLFINVVYTVLLILAFFKILRRKHEIEVEDITNIIQSECLPEVTFIIPVYNNANEIVDCVESVLHLTYRYKQVIVVNDGSTDDTLLCCLQDLEMVSIPKYYDAVLPSAPIRGFYRSKKYPNVVLVDKEHEGKYDALNAGINVCQSGYFSVIDVDTRLDNSSFTFFVRPILMDPNTVAIAAAIRLKNGCQVNYNQITRGSGAVKFLAVMQSLEYLRAFWERQGWDFLGGNFVLAGAFALFKKDTVIEIGGYVSTVAEDMEIIIRLNRLMKEKQEPYKITYLPDPVAWTEGPETWKHLGQQRSKWHKGLFDCLWYHKKVLFNFSYGVFGYFVYPFWLLFEALEPFVELIGFVYVLVAYYYGLIHILFVYLFIAITLGFNFIFTLFCFLIEDVSFRKFSFLKLLNKHLLYSLVENIGYRQMTVFWRIRGFCSFIFERKRVARISKHVNQLIFQFRKTIKCCRKQTKF